MKKQTMPSLDTLIDKLVERVRYLPSPIAILGGHYAINGKGRPLVDEDDVFGIFPRFTMDLACQLVSKAEQRGKVARIALVVDDHSQMPNPTWYREDISQFGVQESSEAVASYFDSFLMAVRSTLVPPLPDTLKNVLCQYGFGHHQLISSKASGRWATYLPSVFQESAFRRQFQQETGELPGCAGEYRLILENLGEQGYRSVISFVPARCQGPICNAIGQYGAVQNLKLNTIQCFLATDYHYDTVDLMVDATITHFGGLPLWSANPGLKK